MNTVNASTGMSPFVLKTGWSPHVVPPLNITHPGPGPTDTPSDKEEARKFVKDMEEETNAAKDSLLAAKIHQAHKVNKDWSADPAYQVGGKVLLAMAHQWRDYMQAKDRQVAKFMPHYNGPYNVIQAYPKCSSYKLVLALTSKAHPTFHVANLQPYIPNDNTLFPERASHAPQPLITADGNTEYFIDHILKQCAWGRGHQFLVRWTRYGPEHDMWLPCSELLQTEALAELEEEHK